ncbi:MAG: 16S rRNA (guanine966-N2)-methyltransferase [Paraglaciecola sp.]|jgi:16S rRNA (guanine966-N2)-methyltransferase
MKRDVKKQAVAKGAIRIISGQWRGRKLPVLDAQGLRPTTDRNKETLFNWLMPTIANSRCLDAFAGSGGLGFEALSRYAAKVTFIELDKKVAHNLQSNLQMLQVPAEKAQLLIGDSIKVLQQLVEPFDVIFLDPPFGRNLLNHTIGQIVTGSLLKPNGLIYIECEGQGGNYIVPENWSCIKEQKSSQIISRLYQRLN